MTLLEPIRDRYLRDGVPTRLGGLAANLARISSFASQAPGTEHSLAPVTHLLEESKWFIEWTGAEVPEAARPELVELQIQLALWQRAWVTRRMTEDQRHAMIAQAKAWSTRLLELSGLLQKT